MTTATTLTRDQALALIDPETLAANGALLNKWLARGDGIAFYENKALDSRDAGHVVMMSYGSQAAQIETAEAPDKMPDTGRYSTPWAYCLVGTYLGEPI